MRIEPHFMAALTATNAACDILDIMPEGDLTDELKYLLNTQFDIFCDMLEGKHYGTNNLNNFVSYSQNIRQEVVRLKGASDR